VHHDEAGDDGLAREVYFTGLARDQDTAERANRGDPSVPDKDSLVFTGGRARRIDQPGVDQRDERGANRDLRTAFLGRKGNAGEPASGRERPDKRRT